jgi:hypothetical protein
MFAWFGPVLRTKEEDLITQIGMDATVFLRILRMCRNIFMVLALLGLGILLPINLAKGSFEAGTSAEFLAKVTPLNTYGNANWGMTICAWLFDIVVVGFLWFNYRAVLKLRRQYYNSPEYQASLHARTLMVGIDCVISLALLILG